MKASNSAEGGQDARPNKRTILLPDRGYTPSPHRGGNLAAVTAQKNTLYDLRHYFHIAQQNSCRYIPITADNRRGISKTNDKQRGCRAVERTTHLQTQKGGYTDRQEGATANRRTEQLAEGRPAAASIT